VKRYCLRCVLHGVEFDTGSDPPVPRPCPNGERESACEIIVQQVETTVLAPATIIARTEPCSLDELRRVEEWAVRAAAEETDGQRFPQTGYALSQTFISIARMARELRAVRYAFDRIVFGGAELFRGELGFEPGQEVGKKLMEMVARIRKETLGELEPMSPIAKRDQR
jgi:hypothetical protein